MSGDQLDTVIETGGRVAEVLAAELGVGVNQVRAIGAEGKIHKQSRAGQVSMRQSTIWMLCGFVLSLAGCSQTVSNCAGWQKISLKPDTAVYVAKNDSHAGKSIAGHNAYGNKAGCW